MGSHPASGTIATVATALCGYLASHVRRHWIEPAGSSIAALSQIVFTLIIAVALSAGLTAAVVYLPLPDLVWLKVLFLVLSILGPWVATWKVLDVQRRRLNETVGKPRTAQALLHTWLTVQITSTLTASFVPARHLLSGYNAMFTVLSVLMGFAVLLLPAFRRETFKLLTRRAQVQITRASGRVSHVIFGLVFLWAYLCSTACPYRQCVAGGGPGFLWALVFSIGCAWLIATFLIQLTSILRWMDDRSRNPGPPPPWLRRLMHSLRRVRSA